MLAFILDHRRSALLTTRWRSLLLSRRFDTDSAGGILRLTFAWAGALGWRDSAVASRGPSVAHVYRFDDVEVDVQDFRLLKAGQVVPVEPKALHLLIFLVKNRGRLIERRELIAAVWGDAFVTDHVLNRAIGQLRKLLNDDAKEPRYIETVPTLGYRFVASVEAEVPDKTAGAPTPATRNESSKLAAPQLEAAVHSKSGLRTSAVAAAKPRGRSWLRASAAAALFLTLAASATIFWMKARAGNVSSRTRIRSLAVLPLENLSGDPSEGYLADGMTDELITSLGQIGELRVISRTTAMQYRDAHKSLPQIARELHVDAIVEGSVVHSGDRLRIAAQLFDAPADKQLWARSFEGNLRDVLGLENQAAAAVAGQIRIKLTAGERSQLADNPTVNPRAYEAFLKGEFFEQENKPELWRKALSYFEQAVELDPKFARAYVGIARCHNSLAGWEAAPVGESTAAADAASAKALELEPELGEAYGERAWTRMFFHWDFPGAERDFRQALELDPGSADDLDGLGIYLESMGRFDEGIREVERAREIDPLSRVIYADYCRLLYHARRYDDALVQCKAALELDPDYTYALYMIANIYAKKGNYPEAHKIAGKVGCDAPCIAAMDEINGAPGLKGSFDTWLKAQKEQPDVLFLAQAYANLGRKDQAFATLDKAYEQRAGGDNIIFVGVSPDFDALRSDPRFDAFLRRAGLPAQPHPGSAKADQFSRD